MIIAILAALAAGVCFASAGLLQQRAAHTNTGDEGLSLRLITDLARQPMWLGGISLAVLSYGFQAVALNFGPLSVVQPLIVMEVVFALPIAARLDKLRLGWRDWLGAGLVTGGLALALFMAAPSGGSPTAPLWEWLILLGVVGGLAALALLLGLRGQGPLRATAYAVAGGSVMGTQSGLFDNTIHHIHQGWGAVFTSWQTYVLVGASIGGLWLIQSAYNSGPLSASMPVFDVIEPSIAVIIGLLLFGEHLAGGTLRHFVAGAGAVLGVVGIVVLDNSPVTRKMHEREEEEQEETEEEKGGDPDRGDGAAKGPDGDARGQAEEAEASH